jgi:cytochrome c oxidase subunit I+III
VVEPAKFLDAAAALGEGIFVLALYGAAFVFALVGRRLLLRGAGWAAGLFLLSAVAAGSALWLDWTGWIATGLLPQASGQGAVIYALQALQAFAGAIGLLMAGYCAARAARGLVTQLRNNTIDLTMLFLAYMAAQGLVGALFGRLIGMA